MKKRFPALLLALMMTLSLAACGGGGSASSAASSAPASSAPASSKAADEAEDEAVDETGGEDEIDISDWSAFLGGFEDGTTIYYAFNEDGSRAALMFLDPEGTQSAVYLGDCTDYDESSDIVIITDDATGLGMSYQIVDEAEGYFELDFGNMGIAYVEETDIQEVLDFMDMAAAETTDITEEFHAAIMGASEEAGEATIDVTGWSCYAGGMDDGSTVYYAVSPDETTGMFMLMSPDETESVFLTGESAYDDAGNVYITDDASGLVLIAAMGMSDDGGYTLDFGGKYALLYDVDPADLINTMMVIESSTTDVTADFIASLG